MRYNGFRSQAPLQDWGRINMELPEGNEGAAHWDMQTPASGGLMNMPHKGFGFAPMRQPQLPPQLDNGSAMNQGSGLQNLSSPSVMQPQSSGQGMGIGNPSAMQWPSTGSQSLGGGSVWGQQSTQGQNVSMPYALPQQNASSYQGGLSSLWDRYNQPWQGEQPTTPYGNGWSVW